MKPKLTPTAKIILIIVGFVITSWLLGCAAHAQARLPICNDARLPLRYYNELCREPPRAKQPTPRQKQPPAGLTLAKLHQTVAVLSLAQRICGVKIPKSTEAAIEMIVTTMTDRQMAAQAELVVADAEALGNELWCASVRKDFAEVLN